MTESIVDDQGRAEPPLSAGERETLVGFLEFHRATLEWKTRDLDDALLARSVPPTTMTLGGLLKHLAFVEDYWMGMVVGEGGPHPPFDTADWDADPDWDFNSAAGHTGAELRTLWEEATYRSRAILAEEIADHGGEALDEVYERGDGRVSLRWVLVHLIEEYARHNGHADLLREALDGLTGE